MSYLSKKEISRLGFASVGDNPRLSANASYYNPGNIHIADHVRIDDFCVLSAGEGGIHIGRNVHVAVYSLLIGRGRIDLGNFSNLSSRVSIYSSSDDYSGEYMTNPTVPEEYTNVDVRPVELGKHVIVGSGSVILPGVRIGEGCAIGALSLVLRNCDPFSIHAGSPAREIGSRKHDLLKLESTYLKSCKKEDA